jgi:PPOX class probable F420-dependent enzyme
VTRPSRGDVPIPASHRDLFTRAICGVLTTLTADGQPRSSLVWVDELDGSARFNTTLDRAKGRDLRLDPRVSLLVVDPDDTARFIQVRGEAELTMTDAERHLDALTLRYTGHPRFYGYVYPEARRVTETRVIGTIAARRITLDAIHR